MTDWEDKDVLYPNLLEAEKVTKRRTGMLRRQVADMHGPAYDTESTRGRKNNTTYELASWIIANALSGLPRVRCKSAMPDERGKMAAYAMTQALNRLSHEMKMRARLKPMLVDLTIGYGIQQVALDDHPGMFMSQIPPQVTGGRGVGSPKRPTPVRHSQDLWGLDPAADDMSEAEFQYHVEQIPLDKLKEWASVEGDGWDMEAIEGLMKGRDKQRGSDTGREGKPAPMRDFVNVWYVFLPFEQVDGHIPQHGYNGKWLTLGSINSSGGGGSRMSDAKEMIREPQPARVHPDGPYLQWGNMPVPGEPYMLGPITAAHELLKELEDMDAILSRRGRAGKHGLMFDTDATEIAQAMKQLEELGFAGVKGFDPEKVKEIQMWGIDPETLAWRDDRDRLANRMLAFSEQDRGEATPGTLATVAAIAKQGGSTRLKLLITDIIAKTAEMYERMAHQIWYEEEVMIQIPGPGGGAPMWFVGGPTAGLTFNDLQLSIEPFSMEITDEATHRQNTLLAHQEMSGAIPLMVQSGAPPQVWEELFTPLGDAFHMPDMGERAGRIAGMLAGAEVAPMTGGPGARVAMSGDVSPQDRNPGQSRGSREGQGALRMAGA
jgi:hypothetical protein